MNKYILQIALIAATLLAGGACNQSDLESKLLGIPPGSLGPQVLLSYPADRQSGVNVADEAWLLFSTQMDTEKTQEAFTLSSGSGRVDGRFRWDGTRMVFTPRQGLTGSGEFVMTSGRQAESDQGADLGADFTVRFFVGSDQGKPSFVSSNPANGQSGVASTTSITVQFSEAVDFSTLGSGITISPSVLFTITQSADRTAAILVPSSALSAGTYTVSVNNSIKDLAGNQLTAATSFAFVVGADFNKPAVTSVASGAGTLTNGVTTNGVERLNPLVITFSEVMDTVAAEGSVGISPFVAHSKTWSAGNTVLTLTFPSGLDAETNYTLSVDTTAKDVAGNALTQSYSYPFRTSGPNSLRPLVFSIQQHAAVPPNTDNNAAGAAGAALANLSPVDITQTIDRNAAVGATTYTLQFRLTFQDSTGAASTMVRSSVVANASITPIINPLGNSTSIHSIDAVPGPGTGDVMLIRITSAGLTAPGVGQVPVWRLRIKGGTGGAQDTNGNTLQSDYDFYFTY